MKIIIGISIVLLILIISFYGLKTQLNMPYGGWARGYKNQIINIEPDSPAQKAGLKIGDIILKINKIDVNDLKGIRELSKKIKPGKSIILEIKREDKILEKKITYSKLPLTYQEKIIIGILVSIFFCFTGIIVLMNNFKDRLSWLYLIISMFFLTFKIGNIDFSNKLINIVYSTFLSFVLFTFPTVVSHFLIKFPFELRKRSKIFWRYFYLPPLVIWIPIQITIFLSRNVSFSTTKFETISYISAILIWFIYLLFGMLSFLKKVVIMKYFSQFNWVRRIILKGFIIFIGIFLIMKILDLILKGLLSKNGLIELIVLVIPLTFLLIFMNNNYKELNIKYINTT